MCEVNQLYKSAKNIRSAFYKNTCDIAGYIIDFYSLITALKGQLIIFFLSKITYMDVGKGGRMDTFFNNPSDAAFFPPHFTTKILKLNKSGGQ